MNKHRNITFLCLNSRSDSVDKDENKTNRQACRKSGDHTPFSVKMSRPCTRLVFMLRSTLLMHRHLNNHGYLKISGECRPEMSFENRCKRTNHPFPVALGEGEVLCPPPPKGNANSPLSRGLLRISF